MREQPKFSETKLRACLREHYDIYSVTLEFLPFPGAKDIPRTLTKG